MICLLILTCLVAPVMAALNPGNFMPSGSPRSVPTDSKMRIYQVSKGDTLWDISRKFKVDLEMLRIINGLDRNCALSVGQILEIPIIDPGTYNKSRRYSVGIAARYEVSLSQLSQANPDINPRNLQIGKRIVVRTAPAVLAPWPFSLPAAMLVSAP